MQPDNENKQASRKLPFNVYRGTEIRDAVRGNLGRRVLDAIVDREAMENSAMWAPIVEGSSEPWTS